MSSCETLSLEVDSIGTSSTSELFASPSTKEAIIAVVKHKLRSLTTSMVLVGPEGLDEKPLSPRESVPETSSRSQPSVTSEQPRSPFSCVPVYIFILAILFLIIIMGGVNAVLELKPEFIYGKMLQQNETDSTNSTDVL